MMSFGCVAGKIALVTGAGSGIGRAACIALAREGATVIAADKDETNAKLTLDVLLERKKENFAVKLNVTDSSSIRRMFADLNRKLIHPTIVINSAGITKDNFILKMDESHFEDVINVNLKGTFLVMQAAAKAMIEANLSHEGSIINLASIVGKLGNIGQGNYSASKAGVEALTKTAAKEFGKFGIRCNAIVPGFIESPMTETIPDKVKDKFRSQIAIGRFGKPSEIAEVIVFLASKKSSYINGASIEVTGG